MIKSHFVVRGGHQKHQDETEQTTAVKARDEKLRSWGGGGCWWSMRRKQKERRSRVRRFFHREPAAILPGEGLGCSMTVP